ncbi:hypothetical protein FI667_g7978, partial [Globisporangium splendens]
MDPDAAVALLLLKLSENDATGALATGENDRSSPTETSPENDADFTEVPETTGAIDGIVAARGGGNANGGGTFGGELAGGSSRKPFGKLESPAALPTGALAESVNGENDSNSASADVVGALEVLIENASVVAVFVALLLEKISGMDSVEGTVNGGTAATGENDNNGDPMSMSTERAGGGSECCCGGSKTLLLLKLSVLDDSKTPLPLKLFVLDPFADGGGPFTMSANGLSYSSSNESSENPECENEWDAGRAFADTAAVVVVRAATENDDVEDEDELKTSFGGCERAELVVVAVVAVVEGRGDRGGAGTPTGAAPDREAAAAARAAPRRRAAELHDGRRW